MNGESIQTTDLFGGRILDDTFLILFNASPTELDWVLPARRWGARWVVDLDTEDPLVGTSERPTRGIAAGARCSVQPRSMKVLRRTERTAAERHPTRRVPARRKR
jgi:isoamylase